MKLQGEGCYHSFCNEMMIDNRVCSKGNTPDVTKGAGIVRPVGTIEFTPIFIGVPVARSLGFCLVYLDHCIWQFIVSPFSIYRF